MSSRRFREAVGDSEVSSWKLVKLFGTRRLWRFWDEFWRLWNEVEDLQFRSKLWRRRRFDDEQWRFWDEQCKIL